MLHVGICCKCLARKGLLNGSKEVEITVYEIVTVRKAVQHVLAAAQEPVTSLVGSVRPKLPSIVAF